MSDAFPVTRWVTGGSYITAYAWGEKHAVLGCKHHHRKKAAARRCAERLTRLSNAGWRHMDVNWRPSSSDQQPKGSSHE
jgi:hypothetical protein